MVGKEVGCFERGSCGVNHLVCVCVCERERESRGGKADGLEG